MSETDTITRFANEEVTILDRIPRSSELPQPMDVLLTPDNREYVVVTKYTAAGGGRRFKLRPQEGRTNLYPSIVDIREWVNDGDWRVVVS